MFFVCVHVERNDSTLREVERSFKAFSQTLLAFWFDPQTIDHHINVVLLVFVQLRHAVQINHLTVDPHANKTLRLQACALIVKAALACAHDRGKNRQAFFRWPSHHAVDHLTDVLCGQGQAVVWTIRRAHSGIQQS